MRQVGLDIKEIGNEFCRLTQIGCAEPWYARVVVCMHVKHGHAVVVRELKCFSNRVRPHHGADPLVGQIVVVSNGVVLTRQNYEPIS